MNTQPETTKAALMMWVRDNCATHALREIMDAARSTAYQAGFDEGFAAGAEGNVYDFAQE